MANDNDFPSDWLASHQKILEWNKKKNNLKKAQDAFEKHKKNRIKELRNRHG